MKTPAKKTLNALTEDELAVCYNVLKECTDKLNYNDESKNWEDNGDIMITLSTEGALSLHKLQSAIIYTYNKKKDM